jgi:PPOX class probable F420-dependent enzyme
MSMDELRAFLAAGTRTAKIATVSADGHPHVVPVWFVLDGDEMVITTASGSAKARHLAADPRVSIAVDDERPPFAFVHVRATAPLHPTPDVLLAWAPRVARRYAGEAAADELGRRYADYDDLIIRVPITGAIGRAEIVG